MMEFVYKGHTYSWNEWYKEYTRFIDRLELPNDFLVDINLREHSILQDIGYGIAFDKFIELYNLIASARSALINSFEKFYDTNIISWESGYKGQLWMRFEYLKNSIIWYNSCEDYIYQIIWFAYDIYPYLINSKEKYLKNLKECSRSKIIKTLTDIETVNPDAKTLKERLNTYRKDQYVYYIREELANSFKHRANVQAKGLENTRLIGFSIKKKDGNDLFNSRWIEPELIDIDEVIEIVSRIHVKLIELGRFILDFMNIDKMFEIDENGKSILNKIQKKSLYKRIDFSSSKKYL